MDYSLLLGIHRSKYELISAHPPAEAHISAAAAIAASRPPLWNAPSMRGATPRSAAAAAAASSAAAGGTLQYQLSGLVLTDGSPAAHAPPGAFPAAPPAADVRGPLGRVRSAGVPRAHSSASLGAVSGVFREVDDSPTEQPGTREARSSAAPAVAMDPMAAVAAVLAADDEPMLLRFVEASPVLAPSDAAAAQGLTPPLHAATAAAAAACEAEPPSLSLGLPAGAAMLGRGVSAPAGRSGRRPSPKGGGAFLEDDDEAGARAGTAVWSGMDGAAVPASPQSPHAPPHVSSSSPRSRHSYTASGRMAGAAAAGAAAHASGRAHGVASLAELRRYADTTLSRPGAFTEFRGGLQARIVEGPGIYYMGLIDILQRYTWQKQMEQFVKTRLLCRSSRGISAVPPEAYSKRFTRRVVDQLFDEYHGEFHRSGDDDEDEEHQAWANAPGCLSSLCLRLCCMRDDG